MISRKFEAGVIWLFASLILIVIFLYVLFPTSFILTGKAGQGSGIVGLVVLDPVIDISIVSPENITYNFNIGDNYNISLNVTSDFAVDTWRYRLYDLRHDEVVNESVTFTPNTTINAVRWDNLLSVYANHSVGTIINKNVTFFVSVPNGAPIFGDIDDSILICENDRLSYSFNATDTDENTLISVDINPKDPFYVDPTIFTAEQQTLIESFIISETFVKSDVGLHVEIISVSDQQYVDTKNVNITVIEINNPPVVAEIGAQTVWTTGNDLTFYKALDMSDVESGNRSSGNFSFVLTFLSGDKFFDIDDVGVMNVTVNDSLLGSYNISVCTTDRALDVIPANISFCGQDGLNQTTCKNFSLAVTSENRAPTITSFSPASVGSIAGTSALNFNASYSDPDGNTPDARWYIDDILRQLTVGSTVDEFSYTFGCGVGGIHTAEVVITDGLLNDSVLWSFEVANIECPISVAGAGGGGGGGGGSLGSRCQVDWVCKDWNVCQNSQTSLELGIISGRDYRSSISSCEDQGLVEVTCGIQIRGCSDLRTCNVTIGLPDEFQSCYYIEEPNCFDGVKNCHGGGCELLVDCGGACKSCATCSDSVQNQGESGVDCGGPCPWKCVEVVPFVKKYFTEIVLSILALLIVITIFRVIRIIKLRKELVKKPRKKKNE